MIVRAGVLEGLDDCEDKLRDMNGRSSCRDDKDCLHLSLHNILPCFTIQTAMLPDDGECPDKRCNRSSD